MFTFGQPCLILSSGQHIYWDIGSDLEQICCDCVRYTFVQPASHAVKLHLCRLDEQRVSTVAICGHVTDCSKRPVDGKQQGYRQYCSGQRNASRVYAGL